MSICPLAISRMQPRGTRSAFAYTWHLSTCHIFPGRDFGCAAGLTKCILGKHFSGHSSDCDVPRHMHADDAGCEPTDVDGKDRDLSWLDNIQLYVHT